jgi:signal peptidase I
MRLNKKTLRKVWWFIWEDDSLASWIVNIILAFVLIKFIIYPGLGLLLGTTYPVVAVVSGSMEHDGSFDDWWDSQAVCGTSYCSQGQWYSQIGVDKEKFKTFIFSNGFNTGDIIVLLGRPPEKIKVGDVIVFRSTKPYPIIHRVVEVKDSGSGKVFETKGDHNPAKGSDDMAITEDRYIGRAVFRIPYLGYIKIWFFRIIGGIAALFKSLVGL